MSCVQCVFPTVAAADIAWLSTDEMIEVDRIMIEDLGIDLIQMMENAGRNLARTAIALFGAGPVVVCVGSGGNGGGGLVAARHLHVAGVDVSVVLAADRARFTTVPAHQLNIVERIGLPILDDVPDSAALILDAVIGYSLRGEPTGRAGAVINKISALPAPVLSLDAPSGLDSTSGSTTDVHVKADATLTLALPKLGLRAQPTVGALYLADISVPPSVYATIGVGPPPDFSASPVLEVRAETFVEG